MTNFDTEFDTNLKFAKVQRITNFDTNFDTNLQFAKEQRITNFAIIFQLHFLLCILSGYKENYSFQRLTPCSHYYHVVVKTLVRACRFYGQ